MPIDIVFTQVHHFKWDSTAKVRIKEVADTRIDYSWFWEYEKLYEELEKNNWVVDINKPEFLCSHQMIQSLTFRICQTIDSW
jgi:hypothetical protein